MADPEHETNSIEVADVSSAPESVELLAFRQQLSTSAEESLRDKDAEIEGLKNRITSLEKRLKALERMAHDKPIRIANAELALSAIADFKKLVAEKESAIRELETRLNKLERKLSSTPK
ncbi:MAG: hypothetical protein L0Z50_41090 [Verrucomicrobiales bacterium]|nr:hypothetical protein [Verrucomicrobiales bacterium]